MQTEPAKASKKWQKDPRLCSKNGIALPVALLMGPFFFMKLYAKGMNTCILKKTFYMNDGCRVIALGNAFHTLAFH